MSFTPLPLPADGAPQYFDSETTLLVDASVKLESDNHGKTEGKTYLTTHRVIFIAHEKTTATPDDGSAKTGCFALDLGHVRDVVQDSSGFFSKKHFLQILPKQEHGHRGAAKLVFGDKTTCKTWLNKTQMAVLNWIRPKTVQQQQVEEEEAAATTATANADDPSSQSIIGRSRFLGASGRRRARMAVLEKQSKLASSAFESIQSLKQSAQDIVKMIETFAQQQKANGDGAAEDSEEKQNQFQSLLQQVGIANPVLREAYSGKGKHALKAFEKELSLELARFVREPLEANGGIMLITDVYCMYNRARGSSLISPEELIEACGNWANLPGVTGTLLLHTFPSGVRVIRLASHTDEMVCQRIGELLTSAEEEEDGEAKEDDAESWPSVSAMEVSKQLNVGLLIAEEFLGTAEQNGVVVRDDTVEGLYYFKNVFG